MGLVLTDFVTVVIGLDTLHYIGYISELQQGNKHKMPDNQPAYSLEHYNYCFSELNLTRRTVQKSNLWHKTGNGTHIQNIS